MTFKLNVSNKDGKSYKLEIENEGALVGKELSEKVKGIEVSPDLEGYEFEITGATDNAGFMAHEEIEGIGLKKVLFNVGRGMHTKPKGEKKKNPRTKKGLRLRKTVRGKVISPAITQVNMKVIKEGSKKLEDVFGKKEEAPAENAEAPAQ